MEVEKYIQFFYLQYRNIDQSYFQLQFVSINIDRVLSSNLMNHYQGFIRRLVYQEHFIQKLFDGGFINTTIKCRKRKEYNPLVDPPKDAVKDKKKKRKDASNYTLQEEKVVTQKAGSFKNLKSVSKFKSLIKERP